MGIFDRVEAKLERAVNGTFARVFRSEVQPVEIASAIRRAMDDRAAIASKGRTFCPNVFQVELSPTDYERLSEYEEGIGDELCAAAEEHAETQRYVPQGPFRVYLTTAEDLETGVFRVRPAKAKGGPAVAPAYDGAGGADDGGERRSPPVAVPEPVEMDALPVLPAAPGGVRRVGGPALVDGDELPDRFDRPAAPPTPDPARVPPGPRRGHLADRPWLDIDGDRYPLMGAMTVIGRDESADIVLDDPGISRRHCEIRVTTDGPHTVASVRDLRSTNGTFVNGERLTSQRLANGDRLTVGRTHITFRAGR